MTFLIQCLACRVCVHCADASHIVTHGPQTVSTSKPLVPVCGSASWPKLSSDNFGKVNQMLNANALCPGSSTDRYISYTSRARIYS